MTITELRDIALHAVRGTAPTNFSNNQVNAAFADGSARSFNGDSLCDYVAANDNGNLVVE